MCKVSFTILCYVVNTLSPKLYINLPEQKETIKSLSRWLVRNPCVPELAAGRWQACGTWGRETDIEQLFSTYSFV